MVYTKQLHHWLRQWVGSKQGPIHYMSQWWLNAPGISMEKLHPNPNLNKNILYQSEQKLCPHGTCHDCTDQPTTWLNLTGVKPGNFELGPGSGDYTFLHMHRHRETQINLNLAIITQFSANTMQYSFHPLLMLMQFSPNSQLILLQLSPNSQQMLKQLSTNSYLMISEIVISIGDYMQCL